MNRARLLLMCLLAIFLAAVVAIWAPVAWAQTAEPAAPAAAAILPQPHPADATFKAWDRDHNGSLSLVEFRAGWQQLQRVVQHGNRLRQHFAAGDSNHNGAIDSAEYGSLQLVKQGGKQAPQMSTFDANRDGKLNFAEYLTLVQALAPTHGGKTK